MYLILLLISYVFNTWNIVSVFFKEILTEVTLRKILQRKRRFKASHWDFIELTHFSGVLTRIAQVIFVKISFGMCQFSEILMTRFEVLFMLPNFSQCIYTQLNIKMARIIIYYWYEFYININFDEFTWSFVKYFLLFTRLEKNLFDVSKCCEYIF